MAGADGGDPARLIEDIDGSIDWLNQAEFDALPFGAIQVDGSGIIHRYNRTESRLSGRVVERVIGRNFFTDVAPCTNIPAFAGLFHSGIAAGSLDVAFDFVFDFHMAPTRVAIRMRNGREPDRYWILVQKLADLAPGRTAEAVAIVAARSGIRVTGQVADFSICEREVIHRVCTVQPFGALLAADPDSGRIVAVSANAGRILGTPVRPGDDLAAVLGPPVAGELRAWAGREERRRLDPDSFWHGRLQLPDGLPDADGVDIVVHLAEGLLIVEAEPLPRGAVDEAADLLSQLEAKLARLRRMDSLVDLCQTAAQMVRRLTGFDRVLIYRFDADWHGEVVAEDKVPDWAQSFAGLHFPASDIPRQARALYTRSLSRHVPDRDATPVPIDSLAGTPPLDLSLARHRSLSAVHLEYHRNMGVDGSMSVSIMVEGRLWGLVTCHHRGPHHVPVPRRSATMALVEALSLRITGVERAETNRGRRTDVETLNRLVVRMATEGDPVAALVHGGPCLVDLFDAGGAALLLDGRLSLVGRTPPPAFFTDLAPWLEGRWDAGGQVVTDSLSLDLPAARAHRDTASGILALRLGEGDFVLWLRPEQLRLVTWGGDPAKPMVEEGQKPLPRVSFERWAEERRGYAVAWPSWAGEIASSLRLAISDVMLRHLRQVRLLSEQLIASNQAKAQFLANMSHELRTPLNAVIGFADLMLAGIGGTMTTRQQGYLADIRDSGQHLLALVNDVLDLSRIDAGRLELRLEELPVHPVIDDCRTMVEQPALAKRLNLTVSAPLALTVRADRVRLRQILLNLLNNAVKFTPAGGRVELVAAPAPGGVRFAVADTGPGMSEQEARLALEPFRQVESQTRRPEEGTGLGLPIAKSLAELHGGGLRIESFPGRGTTVHVTIPDGAPLPVAKDSAPPESPADGMGSDGA
ncbi:MAG: hypothetical protein RLY86_3113 [Pseudomonadota bacterium]